MPIDPSQRVSHLGAYAFAEMDEVVKRLRKEGVDLVDFGVGDPLVSTPPLIRRAAAAALEGRKSSGYPSYIGSAVFRNAAADWMKRRYGLTLDPETEVTATIGSKEAVFNLHEGFVNPGDIVISPSPGYPPYSRGCTFAEGENWYYPLTKEGDFLPNLDDIPSDLASRAKVFWICHPNAPTGKIIPPRALGDIAAFCREYGILLCSDEAYSEIYFDRIPTTVLKHARENVLAFFSLSKRSAMTGYRCGWVAGDRDAIAVFRKVKTNIDSGTPDFIQDAAVAALGDESHVIAMREEYERKRDLLVNALTCAGFPRSCPEAGLYVWQRAPRGLTGIEAAKRLAAPDTALICTPGEWLAEILADGANPGSGYLRFALVPPLVQVEKAVRRLECLNSSWLNSKGR